MNREIHPPPEALGITSSNKEGDASVWHETAAGNRIKQVDKQVPQDALRPEVEHAVNSIIDILTKAGIEDYAISGSLGKMLLGVQGTHDKPNDVDIFTTQQGFDTLREYFQDPAITQNLTDAGFRVSFTEEEGRYGLSRRFHLSHEGYGVDVEVFGEDEAGGTVRLGETDRPMDILSLTYDERSRWHVLDTRSMLSQYSAIFSKELLAATQRFDAEHGVPLGPEKFGSRFVTFLQLTRDLGENPFTELEEELDLLANEAHPPLTTQEQRYVTDIMQVVHVLAESYQDQDEGERIAAVPSKEEVQDSVRMMKEVAAFRDEKEGVQVAVWDQARFSEFLAELKDLRFDYFEFIHKTQDTLLRNFLDGLYVMTETIVFEGTREQQEQLGEVLTDLYTQNRPPLNAYLLILARLLRRSVSGESREQEER